MSANTNSDVTMRTFHATCHCHFSRFSFTIPISSLPLPVHFCHCSICRYSTGTFFTAGASIPEPDVDLSTFTAYKSSEYLTRWFCTTCGAHMLASVLHKDATKWFVSAPSVDAEEEEVWDFASHIYVGDTADGGLAILMTQIGGKEIGLWDKLAGSSAPWHPPELVSDTTVTQESSEDRLHARCHCGGVEFFVSRPTGNETFTEIDENNVRKHKDKWLAIHDVCNTCRVTISTFVISWLFPSRNHITLAGDSPYPANGIFGTAKAYKSSPSVTRAFCGKCGATVSYVTEERSHVVDIAAGLLNSKDSRAEGWLEWRTYKLAYEADAVWKDVRDALKSGLQARKQA